MSVGSLSTLSRGSLSRRDLSRGFSVEGCVCLGVSVDEGVSVGGDIFQLSSNSVKLKICH